MAFNLPTPVSLHTATADDNVGTIGSNLTLRSKTAGNLPITTSASRVQYDASSGVAEGAFFGTSGQTTLGAIDVETNPALFIWSLQFNAPNRIQVDTLANGGVRFWLGSGSSPTSNYREWLIGGNNTPFAASQSGPVTICIDLADTSNNSTVGTFDATDISAYGVATVHSGIVGSAFGEVFFQRSFLLNTDKNSFNLPFFSGASSYDDAIDLLQGTDYTDKIGSWATKAGTSFFLPCAFSFGNNITATVFNDAGVSVVSPSSGATNQENFRITTDAMRVYLRTRDNNTDSVTLSGSYSWGTAAAWDFDLANNSSCTLSGNFSGMGTFTVGASVAASGTFNLATGNNVVCNGADMTGATINGGMKLKGGLITKLVDLEVTGTLEFDTAGTYQVENCTINSVSNTSGGTVTLENTGSTIAGNQGPTIVIQDLRAISITSIVSGSRMQIYNVTTSSEVKNLTIVGTTVYTVTYAEGTDYSVGDVVRVRLTYTDSTSSYVEFETTTVATTTGWTVLAAQVVDSIYADIGIDGSTPTKFTADYTGNDVDLNIAQNFSMGEFYAWWKYNLMSSQGISEFFGVITALDEANFRINNGVLSLFLDSTASASVRQTDNRRIYRTDLAYPVRQPTTGGYGLDVVWRNIVYISPVNVNVPALTSAQSTQLGNIVEILADTSELQANQSNFATATGFSTFDHTSDEVVTDTASRDASKADVSGLSTFNPTTDTVANVTLVATTTTNTDMRGTDAAITSVAGLSTFDHTSDEVVTDTTSRNASKADVTNMSTFNPTTDTVANVTLVATTTTNTDMRGTDAAITSVAGLSTFDHTSDEVVTDTASRNASKADVTNMSTFNPTTDTVANVTLVATTTTNTDMRGTDAANTVAPDNTSVGTILTDLTAFTVSALPKIRAILVDTDDLQQNQTNFATATGFSTFNPTTDVVANVTLVATTTTNTDMRGTDSVIIPGDLSTFDPATDTVANVTLVATTTTNTDMRGTDSIVIPANLSTFDPAADTVANVTLVATTTSNTDMRGTNNVIIPGDLSTFDPAADTVANVTLVATTTTNTDMRGTDGANIVVPDNTAVAAIKSNTDIIPALL